jgi:PAS domain S-box-containing protein
LQTERAAHQDAKEFSDRLESRVAEALAERKIFADVIERSIGAVTVLSNDFTILAINPANVTAFERAFGVRPKVGDRFLSLFEGSPEVLKQQEAIWRRALDGESFSVTDEFGLDGRERRYFEVRFSPLLDGNGVRIGASSTSSDVTERVRAEAELAAAQEQLWQAQKMDSMGQLTGNVAHDFNNLLTPILGGLDALRRGLGDEERKRRLVAAALQSAERARTLVQRLLAFSRRQPLQPTDVDLVVLCEGMVDLLRSTLGSRIDFHLVLADELPVAVADPHQLEMALLNLCVNARDAMPHGGAFTLAVAARHLVPDSVPGLAGGDYVCVTAKDTGQGMDAETLRRATEPFFSTKGVGKGTGLGLSMVDGLARQLGGALAIESAVGLGTSVSLWLPAGKRAIEVEPQGPVQPGGQVGAGLVLLVDDDELVRLSTADMLDELGYQVVEAASALEALSAVREGLRPRLVVTDHMMPGMNGIQLARSLAQEHPSVPVLLVSGYADLEGVDRGVRRLAKPFLLDELGLSLRSLLGE